MLANGVRVIHAPSINPDLVRITLHFSGGIQNETPSSNGIGQLAAELVGKKVMGMTRDHYQQVFEQHGARMSASLSHNAWVYSLVAPRDSAKKLVPLFLKGITHFDCDDALFEEIKTQLLQRIDKKNEDWFAQAFDVLKANVVMPPFSLPLTGTRTSVDGLQKDNVQAYIKQQWEQSDLIIGIQAEDSSELFNYMLPTLKKRKKGMPVQFSLLTFQVPTQSAHVLEQQVGAVLRVDPLTQPIDSLRDHIKLKLVDALLSGMRYPSGLLHQRLRGAQLVYVVHAVPVQWGDSNMLLTYALTEPHQVNRVADIIRGSVDDIKHGFTDMQLADAKSQVMFDYASLHADMGTQMGTLIQSLKQFNNLPTIEEFKGELDAITKDELQLFMKRQWHLFYEFQFNPSASDDRTIGVR